MNRICTPISLRFTFFTSVALAAALALVSLAFGAIAEAKPKDRNRNGIPDRWERKYKLSTKRDLSRRDTDGDGLNNRSEFRSGTKPRAIDSDRDGIEDADEDRDGDKVDNGNEQRQRTHQNDPDSDDDGIKDGREDRDRDGLSNAGEDSSANDPIDDDSDDDGIEDGDENSGTVASFDGTTLVIDRDIGGQISGTVDGSTRVTCEDEDGHEEIRSGNRGRLGLAFRSAEDEDEVEVEGVITEIGVDYFVIALREGGNRTIEVDGSTRFRAPDRQPDGVRDLDDLRVGDSVEVELPLSGDLALEVEVDEPGEDGEDGEDGEEIEGFITSIAGNMVTVERRFGQSWTVEVGPTTYLRALDRDESGSITIDDFRVGDRVEVDLPLSGNIALSMRMEDFEDPDDEDGYEDGEDGDEEANDDAPCLVDLLVPGARIHEAELSPAGIFLEIEVVAPDGGVGEVEDVEGQISNFEDGVVTVARVGDRAELSAPLSGDARIRCKSLYGGKPSPCGISQILVGTLVHEFEVEDGFIDKLVLLK